jgi:hypothetical protein
VLELSRLAEGLEEMGQDVGLDPRPAVDHPDAGEDPGALEADFDAAAVGRELDRVRDEAGHDLAQPMRIGEERRDRLVEDGFEPDRPLLGPRPERLDALLDQLGRLHGPQIEAQGCAWRRTRGRGGPR